MSLLGKGALIFWHDIAEGAESDYEAWHSHEHMRERLGVPGFLRGRRYDVVGAGPRYVILYEVETVGVLTSAPYLVRLNDPTPWTQRIVADFRRTNRTIAGVRGTAGTGVGGYLLTVRVSPGDREDEMERWLVDELIPELAGLPGLSGAHLLMGDEAASQTESREKRLRGEADRIAAWALLVEGYDEAVLRRVAGERLSANLWRSKGAQGRPLIGLYRLRHCLSVQDLDAV